MSIKQRIARAEKALNKGRDEIIYEWFENMTIDGEVIPYIPKPGEKVIDLTNIWRDDRGAESEPEPAGAESLSE